MAAKVFDNDVIHSASLEHINKSTLQEVSDRDYPGSYHFKPDVACLDMDTYETEVCGGSKGATVDCVVGINDYDGNKHTNPRLLFVELRMDYDSFKNLSATKLKEKVENTQNRIGQEILHEKEKFFIFKNSIKSAIAGWFMRQHNAHAIPASYKSLSVQEFNEAILLSNEVPYVPKVDRKKIADSLNKSIQSNNEDRILQAFDYWAKRANAYEYQYNKPEAEFIREVILASWQEFKSDSDATGYDKQTLIELLESDHSFLK